MLALSETSVREVTSPKNALSCLPAKAVTRCNRYNLPQVLILKGRREWEDKRVELGRSDVRARKRGKEELYFRKHQSDYIYMEDNRLLEQRGSGTSM